ncbi:MAG: response regulator [Candidatus Marinimicrobia bacterium]|nr:response regulator [Candidatus Neomarinimicrobiota bacterium]
MTSDDQMNDASKQELLDQIESLEIQLKHITNDLKLTRREYENSTREYFKIYTNLEEMVKERTAELEHSKQILEQKGQELQVMLDSSPALIFYKDTKRRYIRVNKRFAETIGLPIQEIIGKTYTELIPSGTDHGAQYDRYVLDYGEPVKKRTQIIETATGERQIVIDRIPYRDLSDEVIGIIGFAQDVTELKKAKSEKQDLEDQLVQAQKLESIGVLAGGIAHDFNNILATISGATQFLELYQEDENLSRYTDMINASITRGQSITDRVLSFSRSNSPQFKPFSGIRHLEGIKEIMGHTLSQDIAIEVESDLEDVKLFGDPSQLQQVMLNLCINAVDAMPDGGEIRLGIKEADRELVEKYGRPDDYDYYYITVSDTGTGIEPEEQSRIFEPFYTTKEPGKGTGLGLSVAYRILQQHKGWIDVRSEVGEGTTFTLGVPRAPVQTGSSELEDKSGTLGGHGEHIVLVDDEAPLLQLVAERLQIHGYRISSAEDGERALEIIHEIGDSVDLVITDIKMPNMDGIALYRRIHAIYPDLRCMALTGIVEQNNVENDESVRFDALLQKPIKFQALLAKIREVLDTNSKA